MNSKLKEWIEALVEAAFVVLILYFVCFPFQVKGDSMMNTLNNNDRVLVSRIATELNMYEKGDMVVFDLNVDGEEKRIVKRVIALEGELVEIKNGNLYINGVVQTENWAKGETDGDLSVLVNENEIFVLGDNREISVDSRDFGVISKDLLTGKIFFKITPINEFEFLG